MPHPETFRVKPIRDFVLRHVGIHDVVIDPFARNCYIADFLNCSDYYSNDIDPTTKATEHEDALEWLQHLKERRIVADVLLLDPPYSTVQNSRAYKNANMKVTAWHTGSGWTREIKDRASAIVRPGGIVLTFGWNGTGMGKKRGFTRSHEDPGLVVDHGGDHRSTICSPERKAHTC
jgi:hypothetical protein